MTGGVALDLGLLLLLGWYAVSGYRQGFVVSALSFAGFLGGGAFAMWMLPTVLDQWLNITSNVTQRALVLVLGVYILASIGQSIGTFLGRRVRDVVHFKPARALDSAMGAVMVLVSAALLLWFLAGSLRLGAPPALAKAIGESRVLRVIDNTVPADSGRLFASFRQALDAEGFPSVFQGIGSEPITPATPPDKAVVKGAGIAADAASIVKIEGVAQQCRRGQEGSGWVVSPGKIVTNAHVVAGVSSVTVQPGGDGPTYKGSVVVFDPQRDLAVISAPGLKAPALKQGPALAQGGGAVVAGFPLNGPYNLQAARLRNVITARGSDIYGNSGAIREVYSLYAVVRSGNSGGPLLDPQGRVVGVVFAKSLDDPTTGYALTLAEASPVLKAAPTATNPVSTGQCTSGG